MSTLKVWVLVIETPSHNDVTVYKDLESAEEYLFDYVQQYWIEDSDNPIPENQEDAINKYFEDNWRGCAYSLDLYGIELS